MKPAEIYRKHPVADDVYYIDGAWASACITAVDKRFTGAELCAELWRSRGDAAYTVEGITWEAMCDEWTHREPNALSRENLLERFAALPHASDNGYE